MRAKRISGIRRLQGLKNISWLTARQLKRLGSKRLAAAGSGIGGTHADELRWRYSKIDAHRNLRSSSSQSDTHTSANRLVPERSQPEGHAGDNSSSRHPRRCLTFVFYGALAIPIRAFVPGGSIASHYAPSDTRLLYLRGIASRYVPGTSVPAVPETTDHRPRLPIATRYLAGSSVLAVLDTIDYTTVQDIARYDVPRRRRGHHDTPYC